MNYKGLVGAIERDKHHLGGNVKVWAIPSLIAPRCGIM